jgi:MFS transporter, PAT family, beta-lactamase induction signal transducer AmpG
VSAVVVAPASRAPLALSEHRNLRFGVLFLLYVAQGLPFGLFNVALPAWLAQNGASAGDIGAVLAMTMLPWTLKIFYCFLVDRYAFLAMGRRRPWIIIGQFGIVAGLMAMALANPTAGQASLIAAFAFAINIGSSLQDVAVDGLAVDVLPIEEASRASGIFYGGQAIGISLASGFSGYLIAYHGLPTALFAIAAITAAILVTIVAVRERPGERLLPWTTGDAVQRSLDLHIGAFAPIIRNVFSAMFVRQTLTFLPALFAAGAVTGLYVGMLPIFSVRMVGWEKDMYSSWTSQSNLIAGLLSLLVFGFLSERFGPRRMLIVTMVSLAGTALILFALQPFWANGLILIVAIFALKSLNNLRAVTGGAVSMALTSPAVAASQFTLFMATVNLGNMSGSASLGWLDGLGGIPAMCGAIAACSLTAAAFAFAAKVGR